MYYVWFLDNMAMGGMNNVTAWTFAGLKPPTKSQIEAYLL